MSLTSQQQTTVASRVAQCLFQGTPASVGGAAVAVANVALNDLTAAVAAIDSAFDTTLSAAVASQGGATTVINALNNVIPAPVSGGTVAQKTIIVCYVLMMRAGILQ